MEWSDSAIVLSTRRHGESDAILSALTREHGRHMGLIKGGASRRRLIEHEDLERQAIEKSLEMIG